MPYRKLSRSRALRRGLGRSWFWRFWGVGIGLWRTRGRFGRRIICEVLAVAGELRSPRWRIELCRGRSRSLGGWIRSLTMLGFLLASASWYLLDPPRQ